MIKLTAIVPKTKAINFARYADAAKLGTRDAAEAAVEDFEKLTARWKHKVEYGMKAQRDGYLVGPVGGAQELFKYSDLGTRAHRIVARRKRLLRFTVGGRVVFARGVSHPGTKAKSWSKRIAAKYKVQLSRFIQRRIREAR